MGMKWVEPSRSTGRRRVRGAVGSAAALAPFMGAGAAWTLPTAGDTAMASVMALADRSGTSSRRKTADIRKATMATTIASRSVDSAGAPDIGAAWGKTVKPAMAV